MADWSESCERSVAEAAKIDFLPVLAGSAFGITPTGFHRSSHRNNIGTCLVAHALDFRRITRI